MRHRPRDRQRRAIGDPNLSEALDLYVQAGDVVKGGCQDGTLGVDFVLPAKSDRMPDARAVILRREGALGVGAPARRRTAADCRTLPPASAPCSAPGRFSSAQVNASLKAAKDRQ